MHSSQSLQSSDEDDDYISEDSYTDVFDSTGSSGKANLDANIR